MEAERKVAEEERQKVRRQTRAWAWAWRAYVRVGMCVAEWAMRGYSQKMRVPIAEGGGENIPIAGTLAQEDP
eukprot:4930525-Pyramimonas_sp.AAC.1